MGVKTGIKSRAELLFQDNTLTRLGAESYFTFRPGTREMSLDQGTLLLQVPKDHGGATIRSASVTASITGTTIMIEHVPKKSIKVLVLEGSLRLSLAGRLGENVSLGAGKMIILPIDAKKFPQPVTVDLRRIIKTSSLINPDLFATSAKNQPAPLPSMSLIETAIAKQDQQRKDGTLQDTNLVILGRGTNVIAADATLLAALDKVGTQAPAQTAANTTASAASTTTNTSAPASNAPLSLTTINTTSSAAPTSVGSADVTSSTNTANTANPEARNTTANISSSVTTFTPPPAQTTASTAISLDGTAATATTASGNGGSITLLGNQIVFGSSGITSANLSGGGGFTDGTVTQTAGDGGTLNVGTTANPITQGVQVQVPITATSGRSATSGIEGAGGTFSAIANGLISVNSSIIVSSDSAHPDTTLPAAARDRRSASGGVIRLASLNTSGNGIEITNTSQLVAVLNNAAPGTGTAFEITLPSASRV